MTRTSKTATPAPAAEIPLPKGVVARDLKYPDWADRAKLETSEFTLHYTERFGWCVATLFIRRATRGRAHLADRTYAWSLKDACVVTVGLGPHVLRTVTVYVRADRLEALQFLVDAHQKGLGKAGEIRDVRSTRMAQGSMRRNRGWGF